MVTFNIPFMQKPDAGFRLGDIRSIYDAIVNNNANSSAFGITATGSTQATATQLTASFNQVDTVAANTGVNLPISTGSRAVPFQFVIVINNGANSLTVYAANGSTDTINATAGATGIQIPANVNLLFISAKAGVWETIGLVQKSGSTGRAGVFTLTGTTSVTVSNTTIATTDAVIISLNTVGGTVGTSGPNLRTITAATGFTVAGQAGDTSVYNYSIIGASI